MHVLLTYGEGQGIIGYIGSAQDTQEGFCRYQSGPSAVARLLEGCAEFWGKTKNNSERAS